MTVHVAVVTNLAAIVLALPAPNAPLPTRAGPLAAALVRNDAALDAAIDRWKGAGPPPNEVTLLALFEQRLIRKAAADLRLERAVVRRDPAVAGDVAARADLTRLAAGSPPLRTVPRTGPAAPARRLLAWYREAQARFGIRWQILAAVNFVESAFGKVRNVSSAGAEGPMQFEPATWRAYGLGGDVHDPHDAIMGAANYLAANHGATRERDALRHYNDSGLYVDAVSRYAHHMAEDPHAFFRYYSWQVYVHTREGYRRVTGPR
ncbi:MAG: transglycosylase SLT domain-containing protein [Gaiellaceae bacterium]